MRLTNHGRELWFDACQRAPMPRGELHPFAEPAPRVPVVETRLSDEDMGLVCDTVDTTAALAGHVLSRNAIASIARAVVDTALVLFKPPAAEATGDPSNP
ncbi:hypothetical protein [Nocardia sp. CA-145437]|uniref:hypothetical protein n=1 Tax=Nocardia sp. CA-145437 TaxID=3239980 RepID=UPI003D97E568